MYIDMLSSCHCLLNTGLDIAAIKFHRHFPWTAVYPQCLKWLSFYFLTARCYNISTLLRRQCELLLILHRGKLLASRPRMVVRSSCSFLRCLRKVRKVFAKIEACDVYQCPSGYQKRFNAAGALPKSVSASADCQHGSHWKLVFFGTMMGNPWRDFEVIAGQTIGVVLADLGCRHFVHRRTRKLNVWFSHLC